MFSIRIWMHETNFSKNYNNFSSLLHSCFSKNLRRRDETFSWSVVVTSCSMTEWRGFLFCFSHTPLRQPNAAKKSPDLVFPGNEAVAFYLLPQRIIRKNFIKNPGAGLRRKPKFLKASLNVISPGPSPPLGLRVPPALVKRKAFIHAVFERKLQFVNW